MDLPFFLLLLYLTGAGILSLVDQQSSIFITNTTFMDNIAGSYSLLQNLPKDGSVRVTDEDIYIRSKCCNGVIKLVGKGGAIRIQRGSVAIKSSRFINNSASLYGGSIFVDQNSRLLIQDSYMDNSVHLKSGVDDIIHSKGHLKIARSIIHVKAKGEDTNRAIIYHAGDHWSAEIDDLYIKCPIGYDIETSNQSAYGLTNIGLRRSYFVDQIEYWCKPCRYGYAGTDFGYLNYTVTHDRFAYFTLLINGEKPGGEHTGSFDHHRISCNKYPEARSSYSSYWSYVKGSEQQVMECPVGYCSSGQSDTRNKMCAANRSGTLCGQCNPGHTQLYFTPECIQNNDCNPATFWLTYLLIAIFYILFCITLAWLAFKDQRSRSCTLLDQRVTFRGQTVELERVSDTVNLTASSSRRESAQSIQNTGFITLDVIIIIMYYCQDVRLFHRTTHDVIFSSDIYSDFHDVTNSILSLITRFNWGIFAWNTNFCSFKGATALGNQLVAVIFVPFFVMVFGAVCLVWFITAKRNDGRYTYLSEGRCLWVCQFLWHGMFLAMLLTYQGHVLQTAPLMKCVPYMNGTVLFLNGNITCLQDWHYVVAVYLGLWLAIFPIILITGPPLLRERYLSLPKYILFCILPVPVLLYLLVQKIIRKVQGGLVTIRLELNSASSLTAEFLQGSYKDLPSLLEYLCCHGVIVMFRFAMVMMYTCNDDVIRGMVGLLILVFTKLVYTAIAQPYSSTRSNWLSVCGDAALLLVGGTNMAARFIYQGNAEKYTKMFMMFEAVFCVWLPTCAIVIGVIIIVIKRLKNLYK